jgi:hypothetical protein
VVQRALAAAAAAVVEPLQLRAQEVQVAAMAAVEVQEVLQPPHKPTEAMALKVQL